VVAVANPCALSPNALKLVKAHGKNWLCATLPWAVALSSYSGIMMMLAWFIFVATAIMFARYFKGHWPNTKPMGLLLWFHVRIFVQNLSTISGFQFHRTFNMIAVALMIAAFVCIFTAFGWQYQCWKGPPQSPDGYWGSTHSMVGLLAVVLAWVQPIGAIFRCGPGKPLRPIFNWLHRFAGLSAWVLAG
jgi:hypothetical protein